MKFIRIENNTNTNYLVHLLLEGWKLEMPRLVIRVTNGMQELDISPSLKNAFKRDLYKVAASNRALILTDGWFRGTSKLVGQAFSEDIPVIGITNWGTVAFRNHFRNEF